MKVEQITPGAGGMICGNCLRDDILAKAMTRRGWEVGMTPIYLPLTLEDTPSVSRLNVQLGGLNVYLDQIFPFYRHAPGWLRRQFARQWALRLLSGGAARTKPKDTGPLTVSMLQGESGAQKRDIEELAQYYERAGAPDVFCLSNALLAGIANPLRRKFDRPVVLNLQGEDDYLDKLPPKYRALAWSELSKRVEEVDAIVAPSRYYANIMASRLGIDPARIEVAYNGISVEGFIRSRMATEAPVIGYFARMCPEKGLETVVDAFIGLKKTIEGRNALLRIGGYVGPSDRAYVRQQKRKLERAGVIDVVAFRPNATRAEKLDFLSQLTLFSVPARYSEAFGLYLIEAMASGIALVQPDKSAFREILELSQAGLLYSAEGPEGLMNAWLEALAAPERLREWGENGRRAAENQFGADAMAGRWIELYERVVSGI